MANKIPKRIPYFPGCSMATTAKENNQPLHAMCESLGYKLVELKDWNCCGSSSAHSLNLEMRVTSQKKIPVMHFSELLAIALSDAGKKGWFTRRLIDPSPLLRARGVL
ncbi:heterodisulfide reductase-related iron-sulfur binding cluster [Desulfatibacillum aliphaticivorans]|uniref:heterodisulfide reductase-related iron-sulfur binding cluster n=1 Tax=Desulfatibacillum aliphaticivorans TaxID=218208 RepID=UPI0002E9C926|nr:heterodisulfide reductase-related iron-sulfur binding cluster [Desulfatibacillum aliphaticivorans]